ncbi:ATP-dependent RNA helicase DDX52/ROK1 [Angomonas deanei]|nr:ATP-dependent RNA helicase DDX52/ROK1 [Angomonas deanei]|eukprot:EPY34833.1 ATP-dependent RNA helicase DDX52/ROK1 [Angomonas deanei]
MESFKSLSVGANFNASRNSKIAKLFKSSSNAGSAQAAKSDHFSVALPPPANVLQLDATPETNATEADKGKKTPNERLTEDKPLKEMSFKRKKNIWRKNDLHVTGSDLPDPIEHFSNLARPPLNVPHHIVDNLFSRNHKTPTPIQMVAIPALIQGRDVLACAPTGSGKTISFLVPMFTLLKEPNPTAGVRALIVSPTLELAQQIEREAFFLMKGNRWRFVQHGQSTKNKDIFITTPGRVATMLEKKLVDLSAVEYIVFDEGDRLWDTRTDFLAVIDTILSACTKSDKVIGLFTATLDERVENAARSVMKSDTIRIIVKGRQTVNSNIKQRLLFCSNEVGKIVAIRNLLREGIKPPILIFVQSIERSNELYDEIRTHKIPMAIMNAKMTYEEREQAVTDFRLGEVWVLITTELLSRGVDFKNVGTVINFDFPVSVDSYIHRVGRTGRAGKEGVAITFFTEDDRERLPPVAKVMRDAGSPVEDWMLEIKVDKRTARRLERTTPTGKW